MEIVFALSLPFKDTGNVNNILEVLLRLEKCFAPALSPNTGLVYRITNRMVPSTSMFNVKKQTCIESPLHAGS